MPLVSLMPLLMVVLRLSHSGELYFTLGILLGFAQVVFFLHGAYLRECGTRGPGSPFLNGSFQRRDQGHPGSLVHFWIQACCSILTTQCFQTTELVGRLTSQDLRTTRRGKRQCTNLQNKCPLYLAQYFRKSSFNRNTNFVIGMD